MLEFIRVQRFKSLNDTSFPLAGLNLFSGLNGMGKSSLIQTLLLLRQSREKNTLPDKGLLLKGDYVSVGTGQDILSELAEKEIMEFTLAWQGAEPVNFVFNYSAKSDLQPLGGKVDLPVPLPALFTKNFQYLSADRISPKAAYEASDYYIKDLNSIGNHGEYTAHYIAENGLKPLAISALKHKDAPSRSLLDNLDKWMSQISPGIRIHARLHQTMNSVSLSYAFEQGPEVTAEFKPENVGFGLTFVLPVLVAVLRANPGDMIIIENPEAHLHPGGQSVLGRLCSIAAANGVQLFIETHSDHFLNGIRVAVKEGIISNREVKLFYLERSESSVHEALVVSPEIDEQGRIDVWPRGFFDESDQQLEKLL
jgi:predicted ATPase